MVKAQSEPDDFARRPADPYVTARISGPGETAPPTLTLSGLLGDSDREGKRRLYFNTSLDYYAEFATADVLSVDDVPADAPPFVGHEATRVTLKRDARVEYTYARVVGAADDFDLDVRNAPSARRFAVPMLDDGPETWEAECPGQSFGGGCETDFACGTDFDCPSGWTVCKPHTCNCDPTEPPQCRPTRGGDTCATCNQGTCQTCGQATCATCNQGTCQTCGQATCATCNQATCRTCNQATCATCNQATCHTCNGATCQTCAAGTCRTCQDGPCGPTFAQTHCPTCRAGCGF